MSATRLMRLAFALFILSSPAFADETATLDARERFGRGLRLFDEGDNAGALAEFERAYELSPHPVVLYNIGLVYAALGRAVEATDTLDKVLREPSALGAQKAERARAVRAEQAARIAELAVSCNVDGATVEVDGVKVGKTPLVKPLRVASGSRVVGVVAPGYVPERRALSIAGGVRKALAFELEPLASKLGHLALETRVPAAEVLVDGARVGTTPLASPLALAPGQHRLELVRPGYRSARRTVRVSEGALGTLAIDPEIDRTELARSGGRLALDSSEPDVSLSVDGVHQGKYVGSVLVPPGRHVLLVERDGFDPIRREVEVSPQATTTVRMQLVPTPEYRARYERKAGLFRTWGWVGVAGGAVLAGAGTGFLIWNAGEKREARDAFNDAADQRDAQTGEHCNEQADPVACDAWVDAKFEILDDKSKRDVFGWLGVGVGAAAIGTGVVLLLTGDDPDRYSPERPEIARPRLVPLAWGAPGGGGLGARASF